MPTIRPISDLRNNLSEIEKCVLNDNVVFLTKNGRESMVLMSNAAYDAYGGADYYPMSEAERLDIEKQIRDYEAKQTRGEVSYVSLDEGVKEVMQCLRDGVEREKVRN